MSNNDVIAIGELVVFLLGFFWIMGYPLRSLNNSPNASANNETPKKNNAITKNIWDKISILSKLIVAIALLVTALIGAYKMLKP